MKAEMQKRATLEVLRERLERQSDLARRCGRSETNIRLTACGAARASELCDAYEVCPELAGGKVVGDLYIWHRRVDELDNLYAMWA